MVVKYNCVFGGGGVRGLCYPGAVKALKEKGIQIESLAGSSVGAVFAVLYAAGYDETEIEELFYEFNFNMFRDININVFDSDISLSKGEIFLDWLRKKIGEKVYGEKYKENKNKPVTFKDLKKNLYILTLDLNTNTAHIFSKKDTPDEEAAFAVRASAGMPGLMKPVPYQNMLLVDGDLIKSRPAWNTFYDLNNSDTRLLEFRLEGSRDGSNIKNPADYLNSIINIVWYLSTENIFETYHENDKYDYVVLDTKDTIMFDFSISRDKKEKLNEIGYKKTKEFLETTLKTKKEKLYELYIAVYKKFLEAEKKLKGNNLNNSLITLNEILSDMLETEKYIDFNLINEIKELKNLEKKGVRKFAFFDLKPANKEEIIKKSDYIKKFIEIKIDETKEYINLN